MSRCKLEEFISYEQPAKYIVDSDQYDDSYEIPVLTAGKSFILGYTDEKNNIFDDLPVIIFDDFTTSVQFVDFPFKVKSSAMKLLKNTEQADIKYCYYLLKFLQHTPENHKRQWLSATSQNIVELPTIEKQKNIVRKLDKILEVIDNQNKQLELLDEAIKARFVEMFGRPTDKITRYPKVKIANLIKEGKASIKAGPFGSSLKKEFYVKKGFKIYGQEQVIKDDPTLGYYYINEERFNSLKSCEVHAGDILISLVGTCGKTMIMPENFEPGIINPRLLKITFDAEFIIPIYFKYFFESDDLQKTLNSASGHSTMNVVNAGMLKNVELIMAPIELQNQFASFVEEIDKSRSRIQKSLEASQELFDSLMQDYFG